jgi:hypothetical protein
MVEKKRRSIKWLIVVGLGLVVAVSLVVAAGMQGMVVVVVYDGDAAVSVQDCFKDGSVVGCESNLESGGATDDVQTTVHEDSHGSESRPLSE